MDNFVGYFIVAVVVLVGYLHIESKLTDILDILMEILRTLRGGNDPAREPIPFEKPQIIDVRSQLEASGKVVSIQKFKRKIDIKQDR